jgi:hypothetical protein
MVAQALRAWAGVFHQRGYFLWLKLGFIQLWIGDHSSSQKSLRGVERHGKKLR